MKIKDYIVYCIQKECQNNKKKILDSWLKELNLNYNNVAYIGDDINDIELLKLVNFSGCPNSNDRFSIFSSSYKVAQKSI